MKKVILRFLRNKAIEIREFAFSFIIAIGIICASALVVGVLGYLTSLVCSHNPHWHSLVVALSKQNPTQIDYIGTGAVVGTTMALVVFIFYLLAMWMKENWQRAKREIKEENKCQ